MLSLSRKKWYPDLDQWHQETFGTKFFEQMYDTLHQLLPFDEVKRKDDRVEYQVALPGLSKDKVEVFIDKRQLIVKTKVKTNYVVNQHFEMTLPDFVDVDTHSCVMKNGILSIVFDRLPNKGLPEMKRLDILEQ